MNIEIIFGKVIRQFLGPNALDCIKAVRFLGIRELVRRRRAILHQEQSCPSTFPSRLSICAIMKNEGSYLLEWIEFHHLVGIDKFYLYDNGSTDDTKNILAPYIASGLVDYTYYPIDKPQIPAYQDCIARHMFDTEWLSFIDLDEFIVPMSGDKVTDLLPPRLGKTSQIVMHWLLFGSAGQQTRTPGLVIERFTRRGIRHWLSKAIVNPRRILKLGVHEHLVYGQTQHPDCDIIRVNHYHCKSWEEYALKAAKGDVMFGKENGRLKYQRKCFDEHDLNDAIDTSILRFLDAVKSRLES